MEAENRARDRVAKSTGNECFWFDIKHYFGKLYFTYFERFYRLWNKVRTMPDEKLKYVGLCSSIRV